MRAAVAMGADVDRERAGRDVDLVGAEQEHESSAPGFAISSADLPPCPGTKPISSAPTRDAAVCSTEKPFQPSLIAPTNNGRLRRHRQDRGAIGTRQRALPDQPDLAFELCLSHGL